jgi:hypothetical protein
MNRTGFVLAWLVGEGLMGYRAVVKNRRPPYPSEILVTSGVFLLLGILAEAEPKIATYLAWGLDTASFLNLYPTIGAPAAQGAAKTAPPAAKAPAKKSTPVAQGAAK